MLLGNRTSNADARNENVSRKYAKAQRDFLVFRDRKAGNKVLMFVCFFLRGRKMQSFFVTNRA